MPCENAMKEDNDGSGNGAFRTRNFYQRSYEENEAQLYGEHWEEPMVHLMNGIYCKKIVYDAAMHSSRKASHLARKLLTGVFKEQELVKCTFTGQAPRSQGRERAQEEMCILHSRAKNAIIDFCCEYAMRKKWQVQSKPALQQVISQRLGEIKRTYKK